MVREIMYLLGCLIAGFVAVISFLWAFEDMKELEDEKWEAWKQQIKTISK